MIIIGGSYDVHPEDVAAFVAAVAKVTEGSRKEAGCKLYQFSRALDDPNRICLFEIWADKAAFDAHGQAPHFLAYREATGKLRVTRNIGRYEAKDLA
jgi:quinol monooxygenase YgiN